MIDFKNMSFALYLNDTRVATTWMTKGDDNQYSVWYESYKPVESKVFAIVTTDTRLKIENGIFHTPQGVTKTDFKDGKYSVLVPSGHVYTGDLDSDLIVSSSLFALYIYALSNLDKGSLDLFSIDSLKAKQIQITKLSDRVVADADEIVFIDEDGFPCAYSNHKNHIVAKFCSDPKPDWMAEISTAVIAPKQPKSEHNTKRIDIPLGSGKTLSAVVTKPLFSTPDSAFLLLIGGTGDYDANGMSGNTALGYASLCDSLAGKGISSLRIESLLPALNRQYKGRVISSDLVRQAMEAISSYAGSLTDRPIFGAGHSLGGALVLKYLAKDRNLSGIITINSPGRTIDKVILDQKEKALKSLGYSTSDITDQKNKDIQLFERIESAPESIDHELGNGMSWLYSVLSIDPKDALNAAELPAFIIRGAMDTQIFEQDWISLSNAKGQYPVDYLTISDLQHFVTISNGREDGPIHPQLLDAITSWVNQRVVNQSVHE